eukprot:GDKK01069387.1.p1 GENE.GDKK01069387.1~~GDKK01069387.1.p1  ORF type:complete len:221 (-),score=29.21 GDKK01069387.1:72-734(-)
MQRLLLSALVFVVVLGTCVEASAGTLYGALHQRTTNAAKARAHAQRNKIVTPLNTVARVSVHQHTLQGETAPNPVAVALTAVDGTFSLHNIPLGFYTLTVDGYNDFIFPNYKLEVLSTSNGAVRCRLIDNERQPVPIRGGASAEDPVELEAISAHSFFIPREEFSIMNFFKNPMILMMLFSFGAMGLTQLMPKEEMRQSMKEMSEAVESGKKALGSGKKE